MAFGVNNDSPLLETFEEKFDKIERDGVIKAYTEISRRLFKVTELTAEEIADVLELPMDIVLKQKHIAEIECAVDKAILETKKNTAWRMFYYTDLSPEKIAEVQELPLEIVLNLKKGHR